jgi:hypothetical protein
MNASSTVFSDTFAVRGAVARFTGKNRFIRLTKPLSAEDSFATILGVEIRENY